MFPLHFHVSNAMYIDYVNGKQQILVKFHQKKKKKKEYTFALDGHIQINSLYYQDADNNIG